MFNKFEFERSNLPKYVFIAILIIAIVALNIYFVKTYISSNNETITNYTLRDEDMNPIREAAVAGLFYPADVYQLQKDIDRTVSKGIMGTPSLEINGVVYVGAMPYDELIKQIKLAKKRAEN